MITHVSKKGVFSEPEFIQALKNREPHAVEQLVRAYTGQLYRASLGLGFDDLAAHELVQNVWATFFEQLPNFQGRPHIRTYIFGFLYNKPPEARRDRNRYDVSDPIEEVVDRRFKEDNGHWIQPPGGPEEALIREETLAEIEKCAEGLPVSQRTAFWLREVEQYTTTEICKIMNVTTSNLGVLLYRGRNRLRECLQSLATRSLRSSSTGHPNRARS